MDFKTISKGNFFGMLLHALDYYQLSHWSVTGIGSNSAHLATENFYNKVKPILDTLVETTIGLEGYEDIEVPKTEQKRTTLEFSQALFGFIEANKKIFEYSFQQSMIDEIQTELALLMYKIKYLK
jgi:DNA-binding ferritin-like protein